MFENCLDFLTKSKISFHTEQILKNSKMALHPLAGPIVIKRKLPFDYKI